MNDFLVLSRNKEAVLVLLDFSVAFDTINHNLFFEQLKVNMAFAMRHYCATMLKYVVY